MAIEATTILSIYSAVLTLMIGIIGFFVTRTFKELDNKISGKEFEVAKKGYRKKHRGYTPYQGQLLDKGRLLSGTGEGRQKARQYHGNFNDHKQRRQLIMNPEEMMKKARAAVFIKNNGKILRGINMIGTDYNNLAAIRSALNMDKDEFADSVNYLIESEFVRIRSVYTEAEAELTDYPMDELEGKLTAKGVQLLYGRISDPCVDN